MFRQLSSRCLAGWLALMLSLPCLANTSNSQLPDRLATGLMLFELYQDNYLNAVVRMPKVSDDQVSLDYALSLGEFGLLSDAQQRYHQLVKDGSEKSKGVAFFRLGKMAYAEGEWGAALEWLGKAERLVGGELLPELRYYQSGAFIKLKKYSIAAEILGKMQDGAWAAYAYYNLAMAYSEIDSEPTRSIISLRVASALNKKDSGPLVELNDQALLAAGYLSIKAEDFAKAITFLNQIRVESDMASKALYMHGVANASQEYYRAAIQSWYRVKKYPLINSGVADAFLAIPYAYDKEGYTSKAITSYLEAISVFDKETRNIEKIINTVTENGARGAFFEKSSLDDLEWFLSDSIATNTPKVAYLKFIMSDSRLHQLVKQSMELESLFQNLTEWKYNLSVYENMLEERVNGYYRRITSADTKKKKQQIERIASHAKSLKKQLIDAEKQQDLLGVAAGKTLSRFQRIEDLSSRSDNLKSNVASAEYEKLQQRISRLKGLLMWEAKEQYERNLRLSDDEINALEREIERYADNLSNFNGVIAKGPERLKSFKKRVLDLTGSVEQILLKVSRLREQQNALLTEQVLIVLAEKKAEFVAFHEKAQQRLAHLYEYVAMVQYANKVQSSKEEKQ